MWLTSAGVTGVVALGLMSPAAQAIPAVSLKASAAWAASVSAAASRPCRWQPGQRSCSTSRGPAGYGFTGSDYHEHDANKLPFGTERWRDQMRRENRLGNPG